MGNFILCSIIFRIGLPLVFLTCIVFRPCILSAVYLLLLLLSASVPVPSVASLSGSTGVYLKVIIVASTLTTFGQIIFQTLLLLKFKPYGGVLEDCGFLERLLRHAGFIKLDRLDVLPVFVWVTPELVMFVASVAFYVVFSKLTKPAPLQGQEEGLLIDDDSRQKKQHNKLLVSLGKYLAIAALCVTAILKPSVPGGFYFLVFLSAATWWACCLNLQKGFAVFMKFCMLIVFCHIFTYYAYQTDWPQEYLPANSTYARYFGFTPLMTTDCIDPRIFDYQSKPWTDYAVFLSLIVLYFILAIESKHLLQPQPPKKQGTFSRLEGSFKGPLSRQLSQRLSERRLRRSGTSRNRWQSATRKVRDNSPRQSCDTGSPGEETPLIHSVSSTTQKYGVNVKGPAILQDSTGSVIVANENADDIPLKQVPERKSMANVSSDDDQATWFEQMLYVLESILLFIIKTSYIATNIIMMTWSITYHSWLTFVLLLWASMLWMVPNQRKFMLRSSPFLVIYAWFLLISAYIYSMDLTEAELPTKVDGIDLTQIGFIRVTAFPCNQLFVKSLYTIMFWITLKQFVKERRDARQNSALADMVAPLQISVGAATGVDNVSHLLNEGLKHKKKVYPEKLSEQAVYLAAGADDPERTDSLNPSSAGVNKDQERGNKLLENVGNFVRRLLTKFWIWIVAITLFLVAITGQRMTCFRILYMALFLFFILSFLFSFRGWRKIMFGFWLTVIIYSMIILVLVYTYQFNNFPEYWKTYLHVSEQQQLDIGLEKYETKQLFVRLVTPTFFVIITVVQLHYFHKDFLEISKPAQSGVLDSTKSEANSSAQGGVQIDSEEEENEDKESVMLDLTDIDNVSTKIVRRKLGIFLHKLYDYVNLLLVYLELHMPKLVLLVSMVVCVMDVAAIYIVVVILLVFGAAIGKWMLVRIAVNICALIAALLLLARMIYQTQYIEHDIWNVTCPAETDNVTMNDAEWLGLSKVLNGRDLPGLVKWNIIQILAVTVWCIINVRQSNFRASHGDPIDRPYFMFPKIKVTNADKSLINYFKYLANYCFYRLGVEICLIAIVATIGLRMDLYALLYGVWLCVLFPMKRDTLTRWWNVFLVFIAVVIPLQYFMVIGLPPSLCISFPWSSSDFLRRLQEWAFLMDSKIPPPPKKILCDFGLLILVARQSLVFRIEKRHAAQNYPGGSNESIIHQAEEKDFVIPVPDYITYSRNYLDIFKKTTLMPFMWVTLAIVFLAGTNRVNLFSIGYLIGSFYFLWQGSDIYLLPIQKILTQWNGLLGYNVVVIISKCVLQLIGCLFFDYINKDACWLAQLLGISCLRKFKVVAPINPLDKNECVVPREYVGLAWDGACFAFLLLQRRLFQSYNFFHIINETKASAILASRGADLIEELQQKRMIEQEEAERKIIEKIKMKMDRIKANQQKILGPNYENSENHYADTIFPKSNRPMYRRKEPKSYKAAIRSGDYYMFDDVADDELDVFEDVDSKSDASDQKRDPRKRTLSELLSSTLKTDVGTVLRTTPHEMRRVSLPPRKMESAESQISAPYSAPPAVHITRPKEPEPRASTSKSPDEDDKTLVGEPSKCQKVLDILLFLFAFLDSLMLSATNFVNRYSRDHRYVIRVLSMEKKILKETTEYNVGVRAGPKSIWQPSASYKNLLIQSREGSVLATPSVGTCSPSDSYRLALYNASSRAAELLSSNSEKPPVSEDSDTKPIQTSSPLPYVAERERRKTSVLTIPEIRLIAPSMERGLDSPGSGQQVNFADECESGEMSSYDQPTVLRLLLAMWYLVLSHSDILCYFLIFLNQTRNATFLSLPLPLMVFFWGTLTIPRPSKTFWITIIAYTQIIVLIKCMFQFHILPWNSGDYTNYPNATSIIGIEKKKDYAVWDLLLLLVVYFHRFMLKCLGLWKSSYEPIAVLSEGEYTIENGELKPKTEHTKPRDSRRSSDLEQLVDESDNEDKIYLHSGQVDPKDMFPSSIKMTLEKYSEGMKEFFRQLFDPTSRVAANVYSFMFLCDFFNFFAILMDYSSFGSQQGDEGVSSYLEDNRVPVLFLFMLILQFLIIIIDRAIFLRKHICAKIIFQFFQIMLLHIWLFILFPIITERSVNSVVTPQMYYMVKCFYLLLSAYQIRCGYPTRILGNFLCKGYNYLNMFLFKGFMLIPFLFELRTVMDWVWTDTSMTVFDWIKMEDIFAHIYQLKCTRYIESEYPQPRGEKKKPLVKYFMGGGLLALIIGIIWFPLVFFSLGNAVGEANPPYDVTIDLSLGPYEPLYRMTAQSNSIFTFTETDYTVLQQRYLKDKVGSTFISNYDFNDVAAVKLSTDSATVWSISPPDKQRMIEEVESPNTVTVRLQYQVSHQTNTKEDPGVMRDEVELKIDAVVNNKTNPIRQALLDMLKQTAPTPTPLHLNYLLPKFVKVTSRGKTQVITQLMEPYPDVKSESARNISLVLSDQKGRVWWNIKEECDDYNYNTFLKFLPYSDCESIMMYTFNDKIFPATLNIITGGGIIGLYTTLVFVASRVLRGFFSEICFKIMFDDMPCVDRVLQLCLDIYLVREAGEFSLEEDLFAKLVFLYRSPETLIKWTRPIEEPGDEDDPEGDANN